MEANMNIEVLLHEMSTITTKYNIVAEITGERFNVFQILGVSTDEVQTHSAFLKELLDPFGSHGCGNIFLKLFLQCQLNKDYDSFFKDKLELFNNENCEVSKEFYISMINAEDTEGGRIDVLLTSGKQQIIIENKINSGDRKNQLIRYNNFGKSQAPIFYLTLNGNEPSLESCGHLKNKVHYACISYKEDILGWVQLCREKASNFPLVRETLSQYIYLIKSLTHQTTNDKMKNEIVEILTSSKEKMDVAQIIFENWDECKKSVVHNMGRQFASKFGYEFYEKNDGFTLLCEKWQHPLYFSFGKDFESDLQIGFAKENDGWLNHWISKYDEWSKLSWTDVMSDNGIIFMKDCISEFNSNSSVIES